MSKQSKLTPVDLGPLAERALLIGPVIVASQQSRDYFATVREDIRDYLDNVAAVYDPIQRRQKADRAATTTERRKHEYVALAQDAEIKLAMSDYDTAQRANKLAVESKMRQAVELAQRNAIAELAADIAKSGNPDEALDLLQSDIVTPIPKLAHTTAGSTTVPDYVIVNESKIKPEYMTKPQPDTMKIRAAVRTHRKDAESIVGEGSIEYIERVNPRRQSRRQ